MSFYFAGGPPDPIEHFRRATSTNWAPETLEELRNNESEDVSHPFFGSQRGYILEDGETVKGTENGSRRKQQDPPARARPPVCQARDAPISYFLRTCLAKSISLWPLSFVGW